jgi:hypothetical protein
MVESPKSQKKFFEKEGGESGHFHHQPQIETSTFELARNPRSIHSPVSVLRVWIVRL